MSTVLLPCLLGKGNNEELSPQPCCGFLHARKWRLTMTECCGQWVVDSIRHFANEHGIVKIVPPEEWSPGIGIYPSNTG